MTCDFGLLACEAFAGPSCDVCSDRRPYELCRYCLACSFHAWMSETVENVEDVSSESKWNVRTRWAVTDVDEDLSLANVDRFPLKTGPLVPFELLELWIQRLLYGNFIPVDAEVADRSYDLLEVLDSFFALRRAS